jgi:hypothetical protein
MTNKAGAITHAGLQLIAVSLHRLFLGGLLPSRARFRFAGSAPIRLQTQLPQSRDSQLLHTSIVSPTGCTPQPGHDEVMESCGFALERDEFSSG